MLAACRIASLLAVLSLAACASDGAPIAAAPAPMTAPTEPEQKPEAPAEATPQAAQATPRAAPKEPTWQSCETSSDCATVRVGSCEEHVVFVHTKHADEARRTLQATKQCKPMAYLDPPALCIENRCVAGAPGREPSPSLMIKLARGELPVEALIDRERGLVELAYLDDVSGEDPRANRDGTIQEQRLACGDELVRFTDRIQADLAMRADLGEAGFRCTGWSCTHDALQEFDHTGRYDFEPVGGRLRLTAVTWIEGGGVTEAYTARAERWTARHRTRLLGRRCLAK